MVFPSVLRVFPPEQPEKGVSESQAIALSGEVPSTPHRARRESASLFASQSVDGPFRSAQPSGDTPTHTSDDPFEDADTERIRVGFVPVRIPRLTDPIAPCMGFAMQAEVVKGTSKFREFRKAQRKVLPERESRIDEPEGGLFFASRIRGRSPPVRKAFFFFSSCGYLTIPYVIAVECFEGEVSFGWSATTAACL